MAFPGGPCVASLAYTVRLDKPGSLQYTYQYPDDDAIFEFQAQNEMCQSVTNNDDNRWPAVTEEGKWHTNSIQLPQGLNVLQWKAMGISGRQTKPLLIKLVQVRLKLSKLFGNHFFSIMMSSMKKKFRPIGELNHGSQLSK